jgi:hypothetical protein
MADRLVRAVALFGVLPALVVGAVLLVVMGPWVGLLALVVVAAVWAAVVLTRARGSFGRVLAAAGAVPSAGGGHPRWENLVEGLSLTSGVAPPELFVIDRPGANALAVADGRRSALAATPDLLDSLGVVELEAVAANLFGRLKDGSARYGTVTAGLLGPFLGRVQAAGRLVADGLGDQRAVHSDLAAVGITRYPPGLAAALARLEELGTVVPGVDASTAHLWLAPLVAGDGAVDPAVAETALQPLSLRIAVLDEL